MDNLIQTWRDRADALEEGKFASSIPKEARQAMEVYNEAAANIYRLCARMLEAAHFASRRLPNG